MLSPCHPCATRNPKLEISGDTIEEWVNWDANTSVSSYARRMAVTGWGGGIEMAVCSILKKVNVHVSLDHSPNLRLRCCVVAEPLLSNIPHRGLQSSLLYAQYSNCIFVLKLSFQSFLMQTATAKYMVASCIVQHLEMLGRIQVETWVCLLLDKYKETRSRYSFWKFWMEMETSGPGPILYQNQK